MLEHIQHKSDYSIKVSLPPEFKKIQETLRNHYKSKAGQLIKYGITKPPSAINKTDVLLYQKLFQKKI